MVLGGMVEDEATESDTEGHYLPCWEVCTSCYNHGAGATETFQHGHNITRYASSLFLFVFDLGIFGSRILVFVHFCFCLKYGRWTELRKILWEEDQLPSCET